jgi:DNA modification methylase
VDVQAVTAPASARTRGVVTPFVEDADFVLYCGDVREQLRELPDESVHCVVTSPPYWGLRDYGTGLWDGGDPDCDHRLDPRPFQHGQGRQGNAYGTPPGGNASRTATYPDVCGKCGATRIDQQLGLEPTPDQFVANMVDVFREVRRVLRRDGTCWVNLGDSYMAAQGGRQSEAGLMPHETKRTSGRAEKRTDVDTGSWGERDVTEKVLVTRASGLKPKDLCGIPWRVAFALQADGWYLRSDIIWSKPNPMPESVTDRPTKAHEYVFLLTRSPRYFFDAVAVREDGAGRLDLGRMKRPEARMGEGGRWANDNGYRTEAGRNIRSVWEIATQPYPEAHFATFPEALPERCIKAGTSERGCCPECGAPWEREVEYQLVASARTPDKRAYQSPRGDGSDGDQGAARSSTHVAGLSKQGTTTGWRPTCDHGDLEPVPAVCLDPFMGSGTTALVARRLGRRSIGVELNPDYAALCARRLQQLSLFAGATDG